MGLEDVSLDQATIVAVLGAYFQITALQFGLSVHCFIIKGSFGSNAMVGTALMDMYSKCGSLACSSLVFEEIPDKNLVSWSATIAGYRIMDEEGRLSHFFQEMKANSIVPDEGVFTSVLSECSCAGLVNEGKEIFVSMKKEFNVKPRLSHYSCLVDLLGRAGLLDEAYEFIKKM